MSPTELNCEVHDEEMLAIVRSLSIWCAELQGSPNKVIISTDHKALEYFMMTKNPNGSQASWSEIFSQFFICKTYRPSRANCLADAL